MNVKDPQEFLLWCTLLNYAVLLLWFGAFSLAHEGLYRLHRHWFDLGREAFDVLHYGGMAVYKIGILLFNLVPLLALWITGG
ncbi:MULTISPECIES: DUF6868 family protein [Pseudomonas]|uniref:DUF6868 domain-containing protein n=1 Tax=Pseudomonas delhiensis TaxID=366289 RepID=A0A239F391_9PSED|nr:MULTISPECIES: hypothetical protein [Pseudomonas]MED5606162.1 hypothetical protein [Pseudomonas sp. JH-2]PWU25923.1 hypothetical protein DK254_25210 [Pseudomonas sp. RW407]SDI15312.1 hypothetical protein SAMN05216189_1002248 [Pseudomonas delhiensis]SNS51305.1 hypothetical protein SAMN06295949_10310 [Pseudomonas delhiensis]